VCTTGRQPGAAGIAAEEVNELKEVERVKERKGFGNLLSVRGAVRCIGSFFSEGMLFECGGEAAALRGKVSCQLKLGRQRLTVKASFLHPALKS